MRRDRLRQANCVSFLCISKLCTAHTYIHLLSLIGLSAQHQAFTKEAIEKMAAINKLPIIFPLSNPMTNAECTFEQAMRYTNNNVLFASGTAFPPFELPNGELKRAGQGNNMYSKCSGLRIHTLVLIRFINSFPWTWFGLALGKGQTCFGQHGL